MSVLQLHVETLEHRFHIAELLGSVMPQAAWEVLPGHCRHHDVCRPRFCFVAGFNFQTVRLRDAVGGDIFPLIEYYYLVGGDQAGSVWVS